YRGLRGGLFLPDQPRSRPAPRRPRAANARGPDDAGADRELGAGGLHQGGRGAGSEKVDLKQAQLRSADAAFRALGKIDDEAAPSGRVRLAKSCPAVALGDLTHQRKSEAPSPRRFAAPGRSVERLEHMLALRRRDA